MSFRLIDTRDRTVLDEVELEEDCFEVEPTFVWFPSDELDDVGPVSHGAKTVTGLSKIQAQGVSPPGPPALPPQAPTLPAKPSPGHTVWSPDAAAGNGAWLKPEDVE